MDEIPPGYAISMSAAGKMVTAYATLANSSSPKVSSLE